MNSRMMILSYRMKKVWEVCELYIYGVVLHGPDMGLVLRMLVTVLGKYDTAPFIKSYKVKERK